MAPVARYARTDEGVHIAYLAEGDGPLDLLWIPPWITQVEYLWTEPTLRAAMDRLTRFARVVTFDRRGFGLSDPIEGTPTFEEQADDALAVMDAVGVERAAVAASIEGGPMAALFAATHPDRVSALVLIGTFARTTRHVELDGIDNMFSAGNADDLLAEVQQFLTGTRPEPEPDRMLATVLFTDIVDSTSRAAELGDRDWRTLLDRHDELLREALARHRGREVKRTGDGFLATFDGPARGIRCAASLTETLGSLGISVRAGLHTGECEVMGDDLAGLAVHIAARVMDAAGAGEVMVSSTVKDLVVGSGIDFRDRGARELRGVPGEWRLFAVD